MSKLINNQRGLAPALLVGIIALVIALVGAGVWVATSGDDASESSSVSSSDTITETETPVEESDNNDFSGSYFEAIDRGEPLQCDWRAPEELAGEYQLGQGKFYTDGENRGRTTGSFENQGVTVTTHSVFNDEGVYSWTEIPGFPTQGSFIAKAELEATDDSLTDEERQQGEEFRNQYQFSCDSWTIDETMLTPPADIEFTAIPTT